MKAMSVAACISVLVAAGLNMQAYAGANDFFGSSVGSGVPSAAGADGAQAVGGGLPSTPPAGDYTSDEKRVQKKYKHAMDHARKLVAKGESMMKSKTDREQKKGKILKDIGERRLAELKANNPFPEVATREPKKLPN